jgi:hypothetical protein
MRFTAGSSSVRATVLVVPGSARLSVTAAF